MSEEALMKTMAKLFPVLALAAMLSAPRPAAASDQTTGGAGGVYPSGTAFTSVTVSGLELGVGAEIDSAGLGTGHLTAVLLGVSVLGTSQRIVIEAEVAGGARTAGNVSVLTGSSTVDFGDGTPPALGVPFTATLTADAATGLGTVGLVLTGLAQLPNATLNAGSLTIETVE
jgi:hypothetical protein